MKTRFKKLDKVIELEKGKLILLDEKENTINIITKVGSQDVAVLLFPMKTSKEEIINRILASKSSVSIEKIRLKKDLSNTDWEKLSSTMKEISSFKLYIDNTHQNPIREILSKCKKLKEEKNIELVVLEYSHTIQEDSKVRKIFEKVAKDLNITIIVTSELTQKIKEEKKANE